jgi:S-adenosylmethionine decarboxylase
MEKIAPEVLRQRLLMEGYYTIDVDANVVAQFLRDAATHLALRVYDEPIIFSPTGTGKEANQGFDAFIPLIDSGISLYVWTNATFFSTIIYTCKPFDVEAAVQFTKGFFQVKGDFCHSSF